MRSIWIDDQTAFRNKLVLLTLPMMRDQKLTPVELHGVEHFSIAELTSETVIPLLRLLTNQPAYPMRRIGAIPRLDPESRTPERFVESPESVPTPDPAAREEEEAHQKLGAGGSRSGNKSEADEDQSSLDDGGTRRHRSGLILQPPRSAMELLDDAPKSEGSPDHWLLYDGMLLFRFVAAALRPGSVRLQGADAPARLDSASSEALSWVNDNLRPTAAGHLQKGIARGWQPARAKRWIAGRSTESPEEMVLRPSSGLVVTTDPPVLAADITIPTAVTRDGQLRYYAAHEPKIAADLLTLIVLATNLMTEAKLLELG